MKVMVRVPVGKENTEALLTEWAYWLGRQGEYEIDFAVSRCSLGPSEARNLLVRAFLETDCTHLWMIDADTVPPRRLDLLSHEVPIVCGWYLMWNPRLAQRPFPCVFREHPKKEHQVVPYRRRDWPDDLFVADAAGTGCMVIDREVLEEFETDPFLYGKNSTGHYGEDITFCLRAKAMGYATWVDPSYRCQHHRVLSLDAVDASMAVLSHDR